MSARSREFVIPPGVAGPAGPAGANGPPGGSTIGTAGIPPFAAARRVYALGKGLNNAPAAGGAVPSGQLYGIPFFLQATRTVDQLGVVASGVAGAAGQRALVGIYASNASLYPTTRLAVTPQLNVESNGAKVGAVNVTLQAGTLYWAAFVQGGSATACQFHSMLQAEFTLAPLLFGVSTDGDDSSTYTLIRIARAWDGTLPDPFTPAAGVQTVTGPVIFARFSV